MEWRRSINCATARLGEILRFAQDKLDGMRIKKGDHVKIRSGRDRGKTGKVTRVIPRAQTIVVEGVNLLTKHLRPRRAGEHGQRVRFPAPLPVARAMLVCPKCGKPTRIGVRMLTDGKKERRCTQCEQTFA